MTNRAPWLAAAVFLFGAAAQAASEAAVDPAKAIAKELDRRDEALVREGFNLTHGFRLDACWPGKPLETKLVFPEAGERAVRVWIESAKNEAVVQLRGPTGEVELSFQGRQGEAGFARVLAAGTHTLTIECKEPLQGSGLLGVKGEVVPFCPLDPARVQEIAPSRGQFAWPYLLFTPEQVKAPHLLVAPNNTGFPTLELEVLRASGSCDVRREMGLASRLGVPLLVPLFPRPPLPHDENLYLHALTRDALTQRDGGRIDLQLVAMLHDARERLLAKKIEVDERALLTGFSASASFANRFAVLHPEHALAVAVGSPGGWPLAPVEAIDGEALPYPVGVADLKALVGSELALPALRRVRFFFFLGDADENDAVVHRDSFSLDDEKLIFRRFGKTPVERWKAAEALYAKRGLQAEFHLYQDVSHSQTKMERADVERFFEESLQSVQTVQTVVRP